MLSIKTLLLSLATLPVLLAPGTAGAAEATFSVTIDATRTAGWDHPRIEFGGDCNGKPWVENRGSDDFHLWSDATGRLVVAGTARGLRESTQRTSPGGRRRRDHDDDRELRVDEDARADQAPGDAERERLSRRVSRRGRPR